MSQTAIDSQMELPMTHTVVGKKPKVRHRRPRDPSTRQLWLFPPYQQAALPLTMPNEAIPSAG